jgi:hypothetical protein
MPSTPVLPCAERAAAARGVASSRSRGFPRIDTTRRRPTCPCNAHLHKHRHLLRTPHHALLLTQSPPSPLSPCDFSVGGTIMIGTRVLALVSIVFASASAVNCGRKCTWDGDCETPPPYPGPCGWCNEGTCRAPSESNRQCAAEWCYSDLECPDIGCQKCSQPISPLPYGICLSTPAGKEIKTNETNKTNNTTTTKVTSESCAAHYCTSDMDCANSGDCKVCSPPPAPGVFGVCIPFH